MKMNHDYTVKLPENQICPPEHVRHMQQLNRDLFSKSVNVPFILTEVKNIPEITKPLKPYFLKIHSFKPVQKQEDNNQCKIYLNPDLLSCGRFEQILQNLRSSGNLLVKNDQVINYENMMLTYDNFNHIAIFRSVLPEDHESLTGFSTVGHIIHLNLREHLFPYKDLIGKVLLDKIKGCRLVLNKSATINSKYRNFEMEILAQDNSDPPPTTIVTTSECEIKFKFDYAKVFWNPRLSAERIRIVEKLQPNIDTVYDVFAGVGPFPLTAAKLRKCRSLGNDLNPDSYHWMCENIKLNKVEHLVEAFNKDGRDFIKNEIKNDLINQIESFDGTDLNRKFHVLMNLPEIAFDFLNEFDGLLRPIKDKQYEFEIQHLNIHCYCFVKDVSEKETENFIMERASKNLGHTLYKEDVEEIFNVRKVAPNKIMYRLSFRLNKDILYGKNSENPIINDDLESNPKRIKIE